MKNQASNKMQTLYRQRAVEMKIDFLCMYTNLNPVLRLNFYFRKSE